MSDTNEKKRVIITGPASYTSKKVIFNTLSALKDTLGDFIMYGGDTKGIETTAAEWCEINDIEIVSFPIDWKNVNVEGAVVKEGQYGKYNSQAGMMRIRKIIEKATHIISFWDGVDISTDILTNFAKRGGLKTLVFIIENNEAVKIDIDEMPKYKESVPSEHSKKPAPTAATKTDFEEDDIPF